MRETWGDRTCRRVTGIGTLVQRCAERGEPELLDTIEHDEIRKGFCESRQVPEDEWWVITTVATPAESEREVNRWQWLNLIVGCWAVGLLGKIHGTPQLISIPPRQSYDVMTPHLWKDDWTMPPGKIMLYGWRFPAEGPGGAHAG